MVQGGTMKMRYFGTDGIRGRAFESPLTLDDATIWGAAWAQVARLEGVDRLYVGWDPRLSSVSLSDAFMLGVGRSLEVVVLGMVPTPAVAWTVAQENRDRGGARSWGLMISASHNPPEDNGLKGFNEVGEKLSEAQETAIEDAFASMAEPTIISAPQQHGSIQPYLDSLGGIALPTSLRVVIDCAHGATSHVAKLLFRGPGLEWIGRPADGARINVGVGSTHLQELTRSVVAHRAELGIAFDGDGDRCLMVDGEGHVIDGDQMLWLLVQERIATGSTPAGVVGTVMSNGGLEEALRRTQVPFTRTPVGDKFLLRELDRTGWDLAAEASGHVIQKRIGPSGDGLATALSMLRALMRRGTPLRWDWMFTPWPQRLVNLKAVERKAIENCAALQKEMQAILEQGKGELRQVIRWSGTEPKLRLMVEAKQAAQVDEALERLERAARQDLELMN
jgi:phosphoglucosamine mutase